MVNFIGGPQRPSIVTTTPLVRFAKLGQDGPDLTALGILSRFSKPVRWAHVASEIERKRSKAPRKSILPTFNAATKLLTRVAVAVWKLIAPGPIRTWTYRSLANISAKIYGPSGSLKVQRLPFGLYLKTSSPEWRLSLKNEHGALALLQRSSDIEALLPRPLDLVSNSTYTYLLTSRVPGYRLGHCMDTFSDEQLEDLVCQLRQFVGHLRKIQRDGAPENCTISNAVGEACHDFRISGATGEDFVGPFANEEEFNKSLQIRDDLPVHRKRHRIVFTHGDLNMRNILVTEDGKLSGVVDWENAGWYPEYWEYTKALYVTKFHRRWRAAVARVFEAYGDFTEELEIERQLWEYCW